MRPPRNWTPSLAESQAAIALRVYAADNSGLYPSDLGDREFLEVIDPDAARVLMIQKDGQSQRVWYYSGFNDSSPARFMLLVSPWVRDGKRAVAYNDGSVRQLDEAVFQQEAKQMEQMVDLIK